MNYIIERLKEASTWRGLVALATALGVQLSPEQTSAIVAAGMALMGLIGAFTKDSKSA